MSDASSKVRTKLKDLQGQGLGRQRNPTICKGCKRETKEWALRRVGFWRAVHGVANTQQHVIGYSTGRYCADCIAAEVEERAAELAE